MRTLPGLHSFPKIPDNMRRLERQREIDAVSGPFNSHL